MPLLAELCGLFYICALALPSTPANAQADTMPPAAGEEQAASAPRLSPRFALRWSGGGKERAARRFFCPRHLAGEPLQCRGGEP